MLTCSQQQQLDNSSLGIEILFMLPVYLPAPHRRLVHSETGTHCDTETV